MSIAFPIPTPASPLAPPGPGTLAIPARALTAEVGQVLAARVVAVRDGMAELALGGGRLMAATALPLNPGQTLRVVVAEHAEGRVVLRPQSPQAGPATAPGAGGTSGAAAGPGAALVAALRGAGLSAGSASALVATLAATGTTPEPGASAALVAGATAARVQTPAQAAAYVRLLAAGLPATPQAVAGLALLAEGAPIGRALAAVVDAARASAPPTASPQAPSPLPLPSATGGAGAPSAPAPGNAQAASAAPALQATATGPVPAGGPAAASPPAAATAGAPAPPVPAGAPLPALSADATGVRSVADALARAVAGVAEAAVSGDAAALREAAQRLGAAHAAPAAAPDAGETPPATVRALLAALADHPAAEPALARAALAAGETIGAQSIAAPSTPAPHQSATGGAYLQIPLPGGGTAEIRVAPDDGGGQGGGDEEGDARGSGPRTVAMLLHLSALGPVTVTASAGAEAVDARVRVENEVARAFLERHAAELAAAIGPGDGGAPARVRVDAAERPTHGRLLAPTPHDGVDRRA
ncbi:MAG: hypothetical protein RIB67_12000 [Miltoncostaeaceae bacterium]